jgi:FtsP/CotA-like multicopper oxidase with cupredoxin domain
MFLRRSLVLAALCCALGGLPAAAADLDWNPASRPGFWCGSGIVPRGHAIRELRSQNGALTLNLTVRQADDRLCYVADGIAEAPLLRLHPSDKVTITLRNEITEPYLIDTFVAHRYLHRPGAPVPEQAGFLKVEAGMRHEATGATNLHMHGFPVPPTAPQDEVLKTCTDPASRPQHCGTRQITYQYQLPSDMPAGLYWYHPHVHGEVQPQILMGLSGPIVVEGPRDETRRAAGIEDRVLMVRQLADTDEGREIIPPRGASMTAMDHDAMVMPHSTPETAATRIDTDNEVACGNALPDAISLNATPVVGGRPPDQDLAVFDIAGGKTQLWRLVNGATDFYLNLVVLDEKGKSQPIRVVSWDGVPQADDLGHAQTLVATTQPQLVAPGARIEFLIPAPPAGKSHYLVSRPVDTGCSGDTNPERWIARVTARPVDGNAPAKPMIMADHGESEIGMFTGLLAAHTQGHRRLALTEYPRPGYVDQTDFYLTEMKPGAVIRPYRMDGAPNFTVKAGVVEEWDVENWTRELHAFHAHQVHFRVLAVNGKPEPHPPLLDVVNVPFATPADPAKPDGPLKPGMVRIKIVFPPEFAGDIPIHCHLVDHEDNGMMAVVHVAP